MLKYDKTITSAFKAYDACSMPLVDLVEALTGAVNAGAFGRAVHDEMSTVGVDMVRGCWQKTSLLPVVDRSPAGAAGHGLRYGYAMLTTLLQQQLDQIAFITCL